jgi:hypothetical protein
MPHQSNNGDAALTRLIGSVIWVLVVVVVGVTVISMFVPESSQPAVLGIIEKLAVPIVAGLMALLYQKLTKVEHTVNSKSDKQDAKIAELEKQVMSGRQDKRDSQQDKREQQQLARSDELDKQSAEAEKQARQATVLVVEAKPEPPES